MPPSVTSAAKESVQSPEEYTVPKLLYAPAVAAPKVTEDPEEPGKVTAAPALFVKLPLKVIVAEVQSSKSAVPEFLKSSEKVTVAESATLSVPPKEFVNSDEKVPTAESEKTASPPPEFVTSASKTTSAEPFTENFPEFPEFSTVPPKVRFALPLSSAVP